jgi:hypothetical protein
MPDEKFAPSPPNIIIRTMEKDIQALQQGGGEIQPPALPEEPVLPAPAEQGFLQQDAAPVPDAQVPAGPPPPPLIVAEPVAPSIPPTPGEPSPKKTGAPKHLLLALGGIAGLLTLGALGYFVALPVLQRAYTPEPPLAPAPVVTPTPPLAVEEPTPTPGTLLIPIPHPTEITLAVPPDDIMVTFLLNPIANELLATLQRFANTARSAGTFMEVQVSSDDQRLSSQKMFSLLFASSPREIRAGLTKRYAIFLYWVDAETARLGAYFALNPAAVEAVKAAALEWEATLPQDANAFFLEVEPGEVTVAFRDGEYQNIPLRFTVFERGMSIGYAVANNTLVFSTGGRDPMFEALRRLTGH